MSLHPAGTTARPILLGKEAVCLHVTEAREISASGEARIPTGKWRVGHPPCEPCQLRAAAPRPGRAGVVRPACGPGPTPALLSPSGGDHRAECVSPTFTQPPASGKTLQEAWGSSGPRLGSESPWGCLAAIQNVQKGPSPSLTAALG